MNGRTGSTNYWLEKDPETRKLFKPFKDEVLQNFKAYQLPVIALGPTPPTRPSASSSRR
jgi:hypothetical protein